MKLTQYDLDRAVKILPETVKSVMRMNGTIVAGGFLRCVVTRERVKDVDLFSKSPEDSLDSAKTLNAFNTKLGENKIITTKNTYSLKGVEGYFVQFIHRWCHPDPESLLKSFDFTIAKAAMWYDKSIGWTSLVDDEFYPDVAARRLNFKFPERQEDPAGSLLRVLKFVKKGYNIPNESLAGVVARVATDARNRDNNVYIAGVEAESYSSEKTWTKIIHSSIATVTGES